MFLASVLLSAALLVPGPSPFSVGERMRFSVNYLGMRMGTAAINVHEPTGAAVPVELEAHTTGLASSLYDLDERMVSNIAPGSGLPISFVLDTDEKGRKHHDTTDYDRRAGTATVIQRGKTTSHDVVKVPPGTLDFVALVFQLRREALEPGDRRTYPVLSAKTVSQVTVEVVGRETIRTRAGEFETVKIRVPTGFTGKFTERNPTYLWLSDDAARIVVRLSTDFSFGGAVAELISYTPGRAGVDGTASSE